MPPDTKRRSHSGCNPFPKFVAGAPWLFRTPTLEHTPVRRPRADAVRNRARIVETAREVFAVRGADASLEEIARGAGVGIGTLYRHFPTARRPGRSRVP